MISFCYILRDSAKTIEKSIMHIYKFADEILVALDTRTKDNTREVLEDLKTFNSLNIKVYDYEWVNDSFADARNFINTKASGDWIFTIDSDEYLTHWEEPNNDYDYALVIQQHWQNGRPDREYYTPRLYKNKKEFGFYNLRHEELRYNGISLDYCNLKYYKTGIILKHEEKSNEDVKNKAKSLLEAHFRQLETEPDNQYVKGQIAYCYRTLEDWEHCKDFAFLAFFDKDVMIKQNGNLIMPAKAQLCNLLGECYMSLGNENIAKFYFRQSLKFCNDQITAHGVLFDLFKDKPELSEIERKEVIRVGEGRLSKLPFDTLYENIKHLVN